MNSPNVFKRILSKFPQENLKCCFAYGSSVFKQKNNVSDKNMIDFIFAVDNAEKWHQSNMTLNPSHYSAVSFFGSHFVAKLQTNVPARVYFNSMIPMKEENVVIKYGVISEDDLITDLLDWEYLYTAGRLHKPVKIINAASPELKTALQVNLHSAVHAALLILPEYFTDVEFYKTVTALSYNGDFRMIFGEDKNKVINIVLGQKDKFQKLYEPILKAMSDCIDVPESNPEKINAEEINCNQDISPSAKHYHLNNLPRRVQKNLVKFWNKGLRTRQDTEDVLKVLAFDRDCGEVLSTILSNIVWESSLKQSIKGILSAGVLTSVKYSAKKIGKMISSRPEKKMSSDEDSSNFKRQKFQNERTIDDQDGSSASCDVEESFGPALPPHLLKKLKQDEEVVETVDKCTEHSQNSEIAKNKKETQQSGRDSVKEKVIGPEIPAHLIPTDSKDSSDDEPDKTDTCDDYGPSLSLMTDADSNVNTYHSDFTTKRKTKGSPEVTAKRESWMLELPPERAAQFGLGPRQFKRKLGNEKDCDRSGWLETPTSKGKESKHSKDDEALIKQKEIEERNKAMELLAKKLEKKKKREESLLEIHRKKMKKKAKKEAKKREKEKKPIERRPFDRNVDLQVNRFDESQKRAVLKKAQLLNDRFSSGESKFL